jgi:hypothetical protein
MCDATFATRSQLEVHTHEVHEQGRREIQAEPSAQVAASWSEPMPDEPGEVL